jgi:hypothetical protein
MKINSSDKIIAWLTLFSGLSVSAVAVWYSVAGLVSIFAAAAVPIMIMGVALEVSKLVATVWLKLNWTIAPRAIKAYLISAIAILMVITSMGIFGYLSKAHLDQNIVSGDVQSKIAIYDEKIKTARDNIDANRKALKQMDEAVDQVMGRSSDEKGAEKAVAIRRSQQKERVRLQSDIASEQKAIAALNEERAPIAAEVRKVEAEVGPIKYIAALLYGDNPDQNLLEKAVRAVIIIIVMVFDPLAVILLLASQYSFQWFRRQEEDQAAMGIVPPKDEDTRPFTEEEIEALDTPPASTFWPFPSATYNPAPDWGTTPTHTDEVPSETQPTALGGDITAPEEKQEEGVEGIPLEQWNRMIEEAEKAVEEESEQDILDKAADSEKEAMTLWKADNPDSSLKLQRRLFERGAIKVLPWDEYLKVQPDFSDNDAAEEAAKWAMEQVELKKKGNDMDGTSGQSTDKENSTRLASYIQNAEQGENTIWTRIKDVKKD